MSPQPALEWDGVQVRYGGRLALDRVGLAVAYGEVVGLAGPNGSGKSTLLGVAAGVVRPCGGEVRVGGIRIEEDRRRYVQQVGWVPQENALYDELTVLDNLRFFGQLYGVREPVLRGRIFQLLAQFRLSDRAEQRVGTLSGGLRQRASLAAALVHRPTVVLLDEPTAALDNDSREELLAVVDRLRDEGCAVVLATHRQEELTAVCDRVAYLEGGKLIRCGPPARQSMPQRPPVLYGQLRARPPRFVLRLAQQRLPADVQLELVGRRLRLQARDGVDLGQALAALLDEGIEFESYRTA